MGGDIATIIITSFLLAFAISMFYVLSKELYPPLKPEYQTVTGYTITFTSVIFALLVSFAIADLSDNISDVSSAILKDVNYLNNLYLIAKESPDSQRIIEAIRKYIKGVLSTSPHVYEEVGLTEQNRKYHENINLEILRYMKNHPESLFNGMSLECSNIALNNVRSFLKDQWMIIIIGFVAAAAMVGFWFLHNTRFVSQLIIDFCFIFAIIITYMTLIFLNRPFRSGLVSMIPYEELLRDIEYSN